jgi:hypothetical protein
MKNYKNADRGRWAEQKLSEVINQLPNTTVSDIGSGFGWFGPIIEKFNLHWQPFDYVRKIEQSTIWDLNDPVPDNMKRPGFVIFLEVLEHLSNPELGLRNISNHMEIGSFMALTTPNPLCVESKLSMIFKNNLSSFQPKHLIEHHVYVPLPHVVKFHLENNGFEIIEFATIGNIHFPPFTFSFRYVNALIHYSLMRLLIVFRSESRGSTQAFFVKKIK